MAAMRALLFAGVLLLAGLAWGSRAATPAAAEKDRSAEALRLLEEAYARRHFYGADFPGFEAELTCVFGGGELKGKVVVRSQAEIDVDLPEPAARFWVLEQLSIILSHRLRPPALDPKLLLADDDTAHPLGRRISVRDRFDTAYRVRDGRIREVERNTPPLKFVVAILDHEKLPDGKEVPRHFTASYFDADSGKLLRTFVFQDAYEMVGKYALPRRRLAIGTSDDGLHAVEFELSGHKLLERPAPLPAPM
jgi:hypothetical protein